MQQDPPRLKRGIEKVGETVMKIADPNKPANVPPPPEAAHPRLLTPYRAGLLALAGIAALAIVAMLNRPPQVTTVAARTGTAAEVVYATGVVEPIHWAKVTALQRKRILDICKCEGKEVKAGDVLARLDDVEERALLAELQARLARLNDEVARLEKLVQRDIASRVSLEEKMTQVREQEARIAAQQDRIEDLALKSPVDGVVLRRDGEVGEIAGINANDTLLWVGKPKPLQIVAEVNEDDILKVEPKQKALLRHEGQTGAPLTGTVDRITPKGDPQTKTFRVYVALPDDTPLKIGMSIEANIVIAEQADAVLVPAEAVQDNKVVVVRDGRARPTAVEVGIRGSGSVEIRSGIDAGAAVVSPFDKTLEDGERVRSRRTGAP